MTYIYLHDKIILEYRYSNFGKWCSGKFMIFDIEGHPKLFNYYFIILHCGFLNHLFIFWHFGSSSLKSVNMKTADHEKLQQIQIGNRPAVQSPGSTLLRPSRSAHKFDSGRTESPGSTLLRPSRSAHKFDSGRTESAQNHKFPKWWARRQGGGHANFPNRRSQSA